MWKGTAPTLKSSPAATMARPISSSASFPVVFARAGVIFAVPSITEEIPEYETVPE